MLTGTVMAEADADVMVLNEVQLFTIQQRTIGNDRKPRFREPCVQRRNQTLEFGPVHKRLTTPKLDLFRRGLNPGIQLRQKLLHIPKRSR